MASKESFTWRGVAAIEPALIRDIPRSILEQITLEDILQATS
jgi:hypothetical protein